MEMMSKQQYAESFGRWIKPNEIVFDVDDREIGKQAPYDTSLILDALGYKFEVWFAEGQKSAHIHLEIQGLEILNDEQLKRYKLFFLLTHTPICYLEILDFNLCGKHRIAEENKPHYKYHTIKKLLSVFNENKLNYADEDLIVAAKKEKPGQREINIRGSGIMSKIAEKISIIDIARGCGIKVRGKMAICPFHADKNPSLSFDDSRGLFNCFGCSAQGNIVDFIYLLRKNKIGAVKNG